MRIWSISLKYLDAKGLVAVWREALLAKNVLEGKTKGYKNHPQLVRFKNSTNPILMINAYLGFIYEEASIRNYKFDENKFLKVDKFEKIKVTKGQVKFELEHLRRKLIQRSPKDIDKLPQDDLKIQLVPIFEIVDGDIEAWEIL
jgi:hypothetical protein